MRQKTSASQPTRSYDLEQGTETFARTLAVLDAMAAASTLALEEITDHVVNAVQQSLDFEHLSLLLVNAERGRLEPIGGDVEANLLGKKEKPLELRLGQGLLGWVAEHGTVLRVGDISQDHRHTTTDSLWPSDTHSVLIVPLMAQDRIIGVIDVASSHLDAFSDSDEHLMTTIAQRLSVIVENASQYHGTEKQLAEISVLYQLAQRINASLHVQQVLESIVWSLKQTMECRGCSIALIDPVNNMLEIRTAAGVEHKWERDFRLRLGEGIAGRVALEGTPIYVPNVSEQDGFIFFDPSVRSLLTVPLTLQQRVIGTLTVDSDQTDAFSESDERLLTIAATQAAIAIENARLYASLEQRAQNLAEAYAELKQADRLKGEIVRNVSHELRMPLTFVKSYVSLLLDEGAGPLNAEQKEYLEIVARKIDVVTQLVNNITVMQQAEQILVKREAVSLTELAQQAIQDHTAQAKEAGLTFVENLPSGLPPVVGDQDQL
ncbi:MAG: GAF domain-containing protein, partial [Anaerolineae bacterium]